MSAPDGDTMETAKEVCRQLAMRADVAFDQDAPGVTELMAPNGDSTLLLYHDVIAAALTAAEERGRQAERELSAKSLAAAREALARFISPQRWVNLNAGEESRERENATRLLAAQRQAGVCEGIELAAQRISIQGPWLSYMLRHRVIEAISALLAAAPKEQSK